MKSLRNKIIDLRHTGIPYSNKNYYDNISDEFVSLSEFKYSQKCQFSKDEIEQLIRLNAGKRIRMTDNGSIMFDYSTDSKNLVYKFMIGTSRGAKNRFIIRRMAYSDLREAPIWYGRDVEYIGDDTFAKMIERFKKYLKNQK